MWHWLSIHYQHWIQLKFLMLWRNRFFNSFFKLVLNLFRIFHLDFESEYLASTNDVTRSERESWPFFLSSPFVFYWHQAFFISWCIWVFLVFLDLEFCIFPGLALSSCGVTGRAGPCRLTLVICILLAPTKKGELDPGHLYSISTNLPSIICILLPPTDMSPIATQLVSSFSQR